MKKIDEAINELDHHSYLLTGISDQDVLEFLHKKFNVSISGNPDLFVQNFVSLTIDEARKIKSAHETRPIGEDGRKFFIISFESVTIEAQNALLKLLEEPAQYAYFFLLVPSAHILIPTIKSRVMHFDFEEGSNTDSTELADKFIKADLSKRLVMIKKIADDISDQKITRYEVVRLMNGIEQAIHSQGMKNNVQALKSISEAKRYMNDRSPSVKMLLEYVAMSI